MAKDNPVLPSRDRLNPVVFHGSVAGILVFLIVTMLFTEQAGAFFGFFVTSRGFGLIE